MTLPIIGISGLPNSGKDTAADYLVANYSYTKLSMAHRIRETVYDIFDLDTALMNDRTYESTPLPELGGKTVKVALQQLGKCCTDINSLVWVNAAFRHLDLTVPWVVADVRRPPEMDAIHKVGGICIYIHSNRPLPVDGRDMNHESESYHFYLMEHADYDLYNNDTLDWYYKSLDRLMDLILRK